jgi:hypothetical protein
MLETDRLAAAGWQDCKRIAALEDGTEHRDLRAPEIGIPEVV